MANIVAPDLSTAAQASTDKVTAELNDSYGHAASGLVTLYEDPAVPQHQKVNFFRSLGDLAHRGILATVATLTGQPDAHLALGGSSSTPDPVTAPAPTPTPADAEKAALKTQNDAVKSWVTGNGGVLIDGDLAASVNNLAKAKVDAASTVPADMVKKADARAKLNAALTAANASKEDGGFHKSAFSSDMVISKAKYDEMVLKLKELETLVS